MGEPLFLRILAPVLTNRDFKIKTPLSHHKNGNAAVDDDDAYFWGSIRVILVYARKTLAGFA